VVIAIIALLIALLLPAHQRARSIAQQAACGAHLQQLGQAACGAHLQQLGVAMAAYSGQHNDWLVGSPNTSGNGANPGGVGKSVWGGYYQWRPDADAYPAVHIFDWASPLMWLMNGSVAQDVTRRYLESTEGVFHCPANRRRARVNHVGRITEATTVPSYVTSRYFTYVPAACQTGVGPGALFWAHPFVPAGYLPRMSNLSQPSGKLFLADGCRIDRSNPSEISNQEYGYSSHGAWLNEADVLHDRPSLSYRFEPARSYAFRHGGGINALLFDGHVQYLPQGDSESAGGYGRDARQARLWFPSGTDTSRLPSASRFSNAAIIVP